MESTEVAEPDALESLQMLHRDLLAFSENHLKNVDRLWSELELKIDEFKKLLDKPPKNEKSRGILYSGKVKIGSEEFAINERFRDDTILVADALDLDELESAKLYLYGLKTASRLDRSPIVSSILAFHERRLYLLECLRLVVEQSIDWGGEEDGRRILKHVVDEVLSIRDGQPQNGTAFWRKCISSMTDIEKWLQQLAERLQNVSVVGLGLSAEFLEVLRLQSYSLTKQHESLGALACHLTKLAFTGSEELRSLLAKCKTLDKHDLILLHYVPFLLSSLSHCAAPDGPCSPSEVRSLNGVIIIGEKETEPWRMRDLNGAIIVWWLAECSGRYSDHITTPALEGVDVKSEAQSRTDLFMDALREGAFHFMLSICRDVKATAWLDPAKQGLTSFLLQDSPILPTDSVPVAPYFQKVVMEQLQSFVDSLITHMPDTLRKLKVEEDEQRKLLNSRYKRGFTDYGLHLERFLVIVSYAFDGAPDAAEAFWADTEGNLFGFVQWASKRQSTPRVAAFCEMLRSLSQDEHCADSAHKFLQEEGTPTVGKLRRTSSLSWEQIFAELQYYASTMKDKSAVVRRNQVQPEKPGVDEISEPESSLMLEAYLRLVAHLCRKSGVTRDWLLSHETFRLHEVLLLLASSDIEPRLRACIFNTLAALLTRKTEEVNEGMWIAIDQWVAGGSYPATALAKSPTHRSLNAYSEKDILDKLGTGFEEPNAFVELLVALVAPVEGHRLHDALPFPENLGGAYRMPGIEPYVDFVMGLCLGIRSRELNDHSQINILRLNCLSFVATCLLTFNEDLVVFANRSGIPVDSVIDTSSLAAYARLHPFGRVMEWLFNDKVLEAMFSTILQDVEQVNNATPDSPLVLSLVRGLEVSNIILARQATYLDIIRPIIKKQSPTGGQEVANPGIASFEDAVSTHLEIIPRLGLYCGTGHQDLTLTSLQLLGKLSCSVELVAASRTTLGHGSDRSKIISALDAGGESDRIANALALAMKLDERELEEGPDAPGIIIKSQILRFLNDCLLALPNRPTIAHSLLGFSCSGTSIALAEDRVLARDGSLFQSITTLALQLPHGDENGILSWIGSLKAACLRLLRELWKAPISAPYILTELRSSDFLFAQALKQVVTNSTTLWDGLTLSNPDFYFNTSAVALTQFLHQRVAYFEHVAMELRATTQAGMPTLQARIQASLLGTTALPDGEIAPNPTVFDLLDFLEMNPNGGAQVPSLHILQGLDLSICRTNGAGGQPVYDLRSVEELLDLKRKELLKAGRIANANDEEQVRSETQNLLLCLHGNNLRVQVAAVRSEALKAWVQLMIVVINSSYFDPTAKTAFMMQTVQTMLPSFERSFSEDISAAVELGHLAKTLLDHVIISSAVPGKHRGSDSANDKLFQLFRTALNGIHCVQANATLRRVCCEICYRYLRGSSAATGKGSTVHRHTIQAVKKAGQGLIEILCDDALNGQGACRVAALLLLECLVSVAQRDDSRYMMEVFIRLGFVSMLVDVIKNIPGEIRAASDAEMPQLIAIYSATLLLLLRIARTRVGATHVMNAGLFQAIHESQIFGADLDIGLEPENPSNLSNYFTLLLSILRVVTAVILSRGPQSDQTIAQGRQFLKENRHVVVAVFKRHAGIGGFGIEGNRSAKGNGEDERVLAELVDCFVICISACGFLDFEDETGLRKADDGGMFS